MKETACLEKGLAKEERTSYNANRDFTTFDTWRKAREVKLFFYRNILPKLPKEEKYQLGSQIRDAAVSGTANIAEGYGRFHYQEGMQFYRISRASQYELKDHLISCYDLNFIDKILLKEGLQLIEEAKKRINGYIKYVKKQKAKI
ncbi:MAG TPA: four helix bundle protein [Balneolaceae bacterium]|nr:four helix bundle protein [Balneolaceae bacterium]